MGRAPILCGKAGIIKLRAVNTPEIDGIMNHGAFLKSILWRYRTIPIRAVEPTTTNE